jgi:hypothetical protein
MRGNPSKERTRAERFTEGAPKRSRSGWGDSAATVEFRAEVEEGLPPTTDQPSASLGLTRSVRGEEVDSRLLSLASPNGREPGASYRRISI